MAVVPCGRPVVYEPYQLDFVTPGSWPSRARSRKQMRHSAKRRMYPRGRPHTAQRLCWRTSKRDPRRALAMLDFFATGVQSSSYVAWNGMPRSSRSLRPSSSVFAVVTMLISSPRSRSILS